MNACEISRRCTSIDIIAQIVQKSLKDERRIAGAATNGPCLSS
jgi:hypothetical protein